MYTARKQKTELPYFFFGKLAAILLFMIALFLFVIYILPERTAAAGDTAGNTYTITSVQIEEGDSLWSLASTYYSAEFSSIAEYVKEIKRMNGLSSDTIYAGNYILIPHFITE